MILNYSTMRRPTHTELRAKILKARQKTGARDWLPANYQKLLPELESLDLWTEEEQSRALETAVSEIGAEHYVGTRPPQKSYEDACREAELFAFAWQSRHFKRRMYLKFCFVKETLYIVSFHEDKPREKERER